VATPWPFVHELACAGCGKHSTWVEVRRVNGGWNFVCSGVCAGNGPSGVSISDHGAESLTVAFVDAQNFDAMPGAGLYDNAGYCLGYPLPYCFAYWDPSGSATGFARKGIGRASTLIGRQCCGLCSFSVWYDRITGSACAPPLHSPMVPSSRGQLEG
jgi:hypothetical protein